MSLSSAILRINEPAIFEFLVVMNPTIMIPLIATPLVLCAATYVLMAIGLVGHISIQVP